MAQKSSSTSELTVDVTCTPRNRANLRRLKTSSIQSFQRWEKENELLYAMIEDESAWLLSLFPDAFITPELFFYALEDGVILCLLANFIQEMADIYGARTGKSVPGKKFIFHNSKKGTRESKLFHSRENVDKFLTWCRWHGIPEAILFESNDAVLVDECRTGGREIVICLMEIARRSSQYEVEVPQMIKLEREIEEEELFEDYAEEQHVLLPLATLNTETTRGDRSPIDSDSGVESVFEEGDPVSPRLSEFVADEAKIVLKSKSINKFEVEKKPQRVVQKEERHSILETELDRKVCNIAQEYNIKIVHRLKEGKYIILGKTMFVRMLNDHLLVRIGGGWDTLDHYVMTHASKSTAAEGVKATPHSSSDRISSGVWSRFVDKVKRRDSQPNLTESPVIISKRERPDSSPSVYRLRDRVRKKLSVTDKDEKDISDAIRKIESSLTVKSSYSPSFTSKTFFQLKNRFEKGRKSSREKLFDNEERKKMADQTVVTITGEQQKETETKVEEINTSMLLELEKTREATEELATSTTTSETEFYMNEFSSQKQAEESFSPTDDFLSFNQQARQIPTSDSVDLLSNDNPPLFSSEALHPEQVRDEKQVEIEKVVGEESLVEIPSSTDQEAPKSATDFLAKIAQAIESEPSANFAETKETTAAPSDFVPDDKEAKTDHEKQLENVLQESPAGKQADFGKVAGESDAIEVSSECKDLESASQAYDVPELYHEEQQPGVNDHPQIPLEQTGAISEKIQQEDDGLPEQLTSDKVTSLEMEVEIATVSREDEKLEEADRPTQMIREDLFKIDKEKEPEYSGPQVPGDFRMPIQWDKDVVSKAQEKSDECERPVQNTDEVSQNASFEQDKLPGLISVVQDEKTVQEDKQMARNVEIEDEKLEEADRPTQMICEDLFKIDKEKEPEYSGPQVPGEDVRMPIQWDKDVLSKAQEKSDECQRPIQITDEISQDASFDQDKLPGIIPVVQDEKTVQEDKQMARNVVIGEAALKGESLVSPAAETETIPLAEKPKAGQDRKDQKEANKILADTSSATMDHKKNTKKAPTTRKENVKAANSSISKNLTGRKKEDQKAERSKESTTKPPSTDKTAKPTSTTTALKTKTASAVTNARSTSATKRPVSAQTQKTGIGASKAGATKTIPKTTPRSSESRSPPGTTTGKLTTAKDKKPSASSRIQKSKAVESRPLSAVSTKSTDKKDRKVEATARPLSAKMKPASSGTTKTTAKKITTTTKTTSGPVSKFEVSKTTTIGSGITSKTKTTVKKSTESGGKTKASIDGMPQQKASARNNSSEMKRDIHGKPGSASLKSKPPSATTRGKPGNVMGKGKPTSERPKSPAKGTAKKSAPTKDETTASAPPAATESPAISSLQQEALDFMTTPDISAASKENVTTVMQCTEVIKDDGETKVLHTKEVTERVLENGEQQTITKETVVEESG